MSGEDQHIGDGLNGQSVLTQRSAAALPYLDMVEFEEHRKRTSLQRFRFVTRFLAAGERQANAPQAKPGRPPAKKKVPIDRLHSCASHRHARLKLSKQDCVVLPSRLPTSPFYGKADQRLEAHRPHALVWSLHLEMAFRSPTPATRFQIAGTRSPLPATFFDARSNSIKPVRLFRYSTQSG